MARCSECGWYGKAKGLRIHMARVHGVHPEHEALEDSSNALEHNSNALYSESKSCPVPFCGFKVDDLEGHFKTFHEEWYRPSNGRFVFEASQ